MDRVRKRRLLFPITGTERRASTRYPVILEIQYTLLGRSGPMQVGRGRTIDLSSSGISFTTGIPVPIGQRIKAFIDWPVMLNGHVRLQLAVSGVVVRTDATKIAMQIDGHDFRTCSVQQRSDSRAPIALQKAL
jgi:hypothetical protein